MSNYNDSDVLSDILILIPMICKICSMFNYVKLSTNTKPIVYTIASIVIALVYIDFSHMIVNYYSKDILKMIKLAINIWTIIVVCVKIYK